jgi:hypothetical protein
MLQSVQGSTTMLESPQKSFRIVLAFEIFEAKQNAEEDEISIEEKSGKCYS